MPRPRHPTRCRASAARTSRCGSARATTRRSRSPSAWRALASPARSATLVRNSAARWRLGLRGPVDRVPALRDGHSDIGFNPALVSPEALGITIVTRAPPVRVHYRCVAGRCTTSRQVGPTEVVERDVAFRTDVPWEAGPRTPTPTTSTSRRRSSTSSGTPPATPATRRWAATTRRWSSAWLRRVVALAARLELRRCSADARAVGHSMCHRHRDAQLITSAGRSTVRPPLGRRPISVGAMDAPLPPGPREPAALQTLEWLGRPTALLRRCAAGTARRSRCACPSTTRRSCSSGTPMPCALSTPPTRRWRAAAAARAPAPCRGPAFDPVQRRRRAPAHPPAHARRVRPRADGRLPRDRPRRRRARRALAARAPGGDAGAMQELTLDDPARGVRHGRPAPRRGHRATLAMTRSLPRMAALSLTSDAAGA